MYRRSWGCSKAPTTQPLHGLGEHYDCLFVNSSGVPNSALVPSYGRGGIKHSTGCFHCLFSLKAHNPAWLCCHFRLPLFPSLPWPLLHLPLCSWSHASPYALTLSAPFLLMFFWGMTLSLGIPASSSSHSLWLHPFPWALASCTSSHSFILYILIFATCCQTSMGIKWMKQIFISTGGEMGKKKRAWREGNSRAGVKAKWFSFDCGIPVGISGSLGCQSSSPHLGKHVPSSAASPAVGIPASCQVTDTAGCYKGGGRSSLLKIPTGIGGCTGDVQLLGSGACKNNSSKHFWTKMDERIC